MLNKKLGVYAGSFQPFHLGHLNILEKAEQIFDQVIIARGINPSKISQSNIQQELDQPDTHNYLGRDFYTFTGFLTDFITSLESEY